MSDPVDSATAQLQAASLDATAAAAATPDQNQKKEKKPKAKKEGAVSSDLEMNPPPTWLKEREEYYLKLKKIADEELAKKVPEPIVITLPDGKEIQGQSWRTTPNEIAEGISKGLAENTIIAHVNGSVWDLDRPFEASCTLQFLKWDSDEAKAVYWHSSAHMLGEALEKRFGCCLCYGPPIEEGFYYDMYTGETTVKPEDFPPLETLVGKIMKEKQPFERLECTKDELREMFKYNMFKLRIINERIKEEKTTVYRCGPLIDLCRGPHVRHTGKIKTFSVVKSSSAYWEGKADAEGLQRVYGISFPDAKAMTEWKKFQEEAAKRDHRKLGLQQELFFFHDLSPGCCFFLPHGARIYNALISFIKEEYWKRGFTEVVSPNIFNSKLWERSGHWEHYKDDMFVIDVEKEKWALKPMNCPSHCIMYAHRPRSWRELPMRFADFGVLHRNEFSGALTGLTRVRRFQQDDAHIFARLDQISEEMDRCLDFLQYVYGVFGFDFQLRLSTRPEKYLGDIATWNHAEEQLAAALNKFCAGTTRTWSVKEGDGAFYGPKIDITISDALRRPHQCATIQLDFQLPIRFDLSYVTGDENASAVSGAAETEKVRPVMIHRAILGSVERMIAVLIESFAGKWPFWLSPRQIAVIPVSNKFDDYAVKVQKYFHDAGFFCDSDLSTSATLNKKIRNAQLAYYNFIFVVGAQEQEKNTVNVRTRDNLVHGEKALEKIRDELIEFKNSRKLGELAVEGGVVAAAPEDLAAEPADE